MIQGLKYQSISDNLIKMIDNILDSKEFNENEFDDLDNDEKLIYKMIIKKCNIAGKINVRLDRLNTDEVEKLKNDFNVVIGEIEAGNNNPKLLTDAKKMINEMLNKKMISNNQALNLLRNL